MLKTIYHQLTGKCHKIMAAISGSIRNNKLRKAGNTIGEHVRISSGSVLEGKNCIGSYSCLNGAHIGYGSYIRECCYFEGTQIGKFCSVAGNVRVIAGNHPTKNFCAMHPAFYSTAMNHLFDYSSCKKYTDVKFADKEKCWYVVIGSDVWLGTNACIMEGVTIGNGAVIGANALVTKDVASYEIVGGVPAKHIGWRFTQEQRAFMDSFAWWEKDDGWIREHIDLFSDIERFIQEATE